MEFSTFGRHVIADGWGIDFNLLNDAELLQKYMVEIAKACSLTIVSIQAYSFQPQGVTIMMLIAESHFSIHTYPEKGFAAVDCYTCGDTVDPQDVVSRFLAILKPVKFHVTEFVRGVEADTLDNAVPRSKHGIGTTPPTHIR